MNAMLGARHRAFHPPEQHNPGVAVLSPGYRSDHEQGRMGAVAARAG